jgi:hypothetical protein
VSAAYRELFDRALQQVLEQNRWQIVEIKRRKPSVRLRNVVCDSHAAAARLGNTTAKGRDAMDARADASPAELSFCRFAMPRRRRRSLRDGRCDRQGLSETLQCGAHPPPRTTRRPYGTQIVLLVLCPEWRRLDNADRC